MTQFSTVGASLIAVGAFLAAPVPAETREPIPSPAPTEPAIAAKKPRLPGMTAFIQQAVANGLEEDGLSPALANQLGKRDDFLPTDRCKKAVELS